MKQLSQGIKMTLILLYQLQGVGGQVVGAIKNPSFEH